MNRLFLGHRIISRHMTTRSFYPSKNSKIVVESSDIYMTIAVVAGLTYLYKINKLQKELEITKYKYYQKVQNEKENVE